MKTEMTGYDAVIVGAGTAGLYFGLRLREKGFRTLILEKDREEAIASRLDIIHLPAAMYERCGIVPPTPGSEEYSEEFFENRTRSALDTFEKVNACHIYAVHLPVFNRRLREMYREAGGELLSEARFTGLIRQEGEIRGILFEKDGEEREVLGELIVDAAGIEAPVRKAVRDGIMEDREVGPLDRFYVILKCVRYLDPADGTKDSCGWPYYKTWIGPYKKEGTGIIGCGASTSFEYCRYMMEKFEKRIPRRPYEIDHFEYGSTPYTRTPDSFVSGHFLALGDAAMLTNPMSGEGIDYHFQFIDLALPVIEKTLLEKKADLDGLWPINVAYRRQIDADVQNTRASVVCIMKMNEQENEYLFRNALIFHSDNEKEGNFAKALLKGVLTGRFRFRVLMEVLKGLARADRIRRHYLAFPEDPRKFQEWRQRAAVLWQKAGRITDLDVMPEEMKGEVS